MISKVVFVGTPQFAVPTFLSLINSEFKPLLLITQPDRPKGRKLVLTPPEVKTLALEYQIPLIQPDNINDEECIHILSDLNPDIIITLSYGGFIGRTIRKMPPYGVLNIHPSLLPLYRGSTPIQSALLNGDKETGISIFKLIAQMDAGPIIFQKRISIADHWNFTDLDNYLSQESAQNIIQLLRFCNQLKSLDDYHQLFIKQPTENKKDTTKVYRETLLLNWNSTAEVILNQIRAYSYTPGMFTFIRKNQLKILKAEMTSDKSNSSPGTIVSVLKNIGFTVSTLDYDILIKEVQAQGKRIMSASEYQIGVRDFVGEVFTHGL